MPSAFRSWYCSATLLACLAGPLAAVDPTQRPLIDLAQAGAEMKLVSNAAEQVVVARAANGTGIDIACKHGSNGYPGVQLKPEGDGAVWDLSKVGHIAVTITNTGTDKIGVSLRVDNPGDWKTSPWNGENAYLKPGETRTVVVHFGYSWGKKGFALDPAKISQVLVFMGNPKTDQSFRIESITTGGEPGEAPPVPADQVRTKPKDGIILGAGSALDAKQVEGKGLTATLASADGAQNVRLAAEAGKDGRVTLRPAIGRWDLRDYIEVLVRVRNDGTAPVQAKAQLDGGGPTDWISAEVAPGASAKLLVPFAAAKISDGSRNSGSRFNSDAAAAVVVAVEKGDAARSLIVEGVTAGLTVDVPAWLGTKPPVDGEWTKTFSDEFDGTTIDREKWNIYTANYWDKRTHFSAENILVGNGTVKLHYEKKTGFHNDDPKEKQTDYACGFLDTYGKWTQRYGYFEARMKVPRAPGLWPAFWTMPDRGVAAGEQWKRASTSNGGMELDIMEHLTRWGPYRYNIANHWDGYGKEHKANGTSNAYVGPDKDGFMTCGVLWEPGKVTYYGNGKPVLQWEDARVGSVQSYPILYMVSGGWDNSPLDDSALPADFEIDWIRIWQRKDLAEAPATP
jgi:beta-glucanase (GH16 family)